MSQYFLAGNAWSIFAVLAFIGCKEERYQPTMYSFFGVSGWLSPEQYTRFQSGLIIVAIACFVLHWWPRRTAASRQNDQGVTE
ncbi:MAG: hypothetical protein JWP89_3682 [Schlesneria sp.]|nr:hypothetical protein [Schlesneria sp.]